MIANSYYDHSDSSIKHYIHHLPSFYTEINQRKIFKVFIVPTTVKYLDGTSEIIYSTRNQEQRLEENSLGTTMIKVKFEISSEQYSIEQQVNYQPVVNSRRMLDTSQSETVEKDEDDENAFYNFFFVLSQLGGFYSFLQLIFSPILSKIYEGMLTVDLINKYKEISIKSTPKIEEKINRDMPPQFSEEQKRLFLRSNDMSMKDHQVEGGEDDNYGAGYDMQEDHDQQVLQRSKLKKRSQDKKNQIYTYWDGIKYSFSMKCRNKKKLDDLDSSTELLELSPFDEDVKMLNSEIDIMKMVQTFKEIESMVNSLSECIVAIHESIAMIQNNNQLERSQNTIANENLIKDEDSKAIYSKHDDNLLQNQSSDINSNKVIERSKSKLEKPEYADVEKQTRRTSANQFTTSVSHINRIIESEINRFANQSSTQSQKDQNTMNMKSKQLDNSKAINQKSSIYDFQEFDRILEDNKYL